MATIPEAQFLYLSTLGWKTGKKHRIEIWFVEHNGRYYVVSERKKDAHWVQNIIHHPEVSFSVSGRTIDGRAKIISQEIEEGAAGDVADLMKEKYGWSDGLTVELTPEQ